MSPRTSRAAPQVGGDAWICQNPKSCPSWLQELEPWGLLNMWCSFVTKAQPGDW